MSSVLSRAIGGFAKAGAEIATDRLDELRKQRLMELDEQYRANERDKNQQFTASQNQLARDQQDKQHKDVVDYQNKSLAQQKSNMDADNSRASAQLDVLKDDKEFQRVSGAYNMSLNEVGQLHNDLQALLKQKGTVDSNGQMVDNEKIQRAIEDTQIKLAEAKTQALQNLKAIQQTFPQYLKYFPTLNKPAATTSSANTPPPLLARPQPSEQQPQPNYLQGVQIAR